MFKLYRNFKLKDWITIAVIIAITFLQVWCTMTIVDYIKDIIQSIMYVNYHNHPALMGDMAAQSVKALGWDGAVEAMKASGMIGAEVIATMRDIANATTGDIWRCAGMMLALAGLLVLAQAVVSVLASYVSADLSTNIRSKIYGKVDGFSLGEINRFQTASLITRTTNDIQNVQMTNVMMMRMIFAAPITAVWAILKIKASSTELTIATAIAIVVMLIFITAMITVVMPRFRIVQKLIDKVNGVARENLTGIRIIRAFNAEQYQEEKFEAANDILTKTHIFTGRVMSLMSPVMMIIMNGITLTIYWLGAHLINKGSIDYATVTSFSTLSSQIIMAFMMLMMMFVMWPRASVCANRINEVLDTASAIRDPENPKKPTEAGTVEFKNVSFRYPDGDEYALRDISFKANKGETVAFIGATGSGKTSVVNLIPRFFDATEGEVLVDGVNVKELTQETLHAKIGYVPQKGFLFRGSVAENVALGNPEMSRENIEDACRIAEADDFIHENEEGYEFNISQGGKNVSGGQRQRLCIARAVAIHPEIYIFDDSFSALDYKTDKKVRDNLSAMNDGATRLIVAQRIGTIMDADRIIVIENGKVAGSGTHKELLENCPVYLDIALSQLTKEELGLCR
ncbi:MAG: ABC transporter ATP-binding protein/permease [Clostridia bacterium]|nr:ABC transporter ATP-binding protein/permease [Clostridia bacterium]